MILLIIRLWDLVLLQTGHHIDLFVTKQIPCYVQLKQDILVIFHPHLGVACMVSFGDIFNLCLSVPILIVIYNFQLLPINIFCQFHICKIIADVTSIVPTTEFVQRFFDNKTVPSMQFACVDIEIVSSIVNSLYS